MDRKMRNKCVSEQNNAKEELVDDHAEKENGGMKENRSETLINGFDQL